MDIHLIVDPAAQTEPEHTVVFLTGALAPIEIFSKAREAFDDSFTLIYYPFPGLNGRPVAPPLDIQKEGRRLAAFVEQYQPDQVSLVGYSTGAAIAIEAAHHVSADHRLSLALISPSAERAGGLATALTGARDIFSAAKRAGSFDLNLLWPEYWKLLLIGRQSYLDNGRSQYANSMLQRNHANLVIPTSEVRKAHTLSLKHWVVPDGFSAINRRIGVFYGAVDPVFSNRQTQNLIEKLLSVHVVKYSNQGHLVPISELNIYYDIKNFLFK
ncbi:MAG: alpha/beta hydrolase [Pseudoruegeria sp.]